jgi:hypothetical protein
MWEGVEFSKGFQGLFVGIVGPVGFCAFLIALLISAFATRAARQLGAKLFVWAITAICALLLVRTFVTFASPEQTYVQNDFATILVSMFLLAPFADGWIVGWLIGCCLPARKDSEGEPQQ